MKVVSVNISKEKGTVKGPVEGIRLNEFGVENDAHAGHWNRQVSLLGVESIEKFAKQIDKNLGYGDFAENVTTQDINLYELNPLDTLSIGDTMLEVTQIGKKCHGSNCQIFQLSGDCIMPKEGIFARVVKHGEIKAGMEITYTPRVINVLVITLSDRAAHGIYEDKSGPLLEQGIEEFLKSKNRKFMVTRKIIPDDKNKLNEVLKEFATYDIIFTTGSTGIGPRDIAPDNVKPWLDKEIPGIMELIRYKYGAEKPGVLLSRGVAGVKGKTLVYTLPGSPKAIKEYTTEIFKTLQHSLYMLHSLDIH